MMGKYDIGHPTVGIASDDYSIMIFQQSMSLERLIPNTHAQ